MLPPDPPRVALKEHRQDSLLLHCGARVMLAGPFHQWWTFPGAHVLKRWMILVVNIKLIIPFWKFKIINHDEPLVACNTYQPTINSVLVLPFSPWKLPATNPQVLRVWTLQTWVYASVVMDREISWCILVDGDTVSVATQATSEYGGKPSRWRWWSSCCHGHSNACIVMLNRISLTIVTIVWWSLHGAPVPVGSLLVQYVLLSGKHW